MVGLEITIVKARLEFLILLPLHSGMTLCLAPKGFSSTYFSRSDHLCYNCRFLGERTWKQQALSGRTAYVSWQSVPGIFAFLHSLLYQKFSFLCSLSGCCWPRATHWCLCCGTHGVTRHLVGALVGPGPSSRAFKQYIGRHLLWRLKVFRFSFGLQAQRHRSISQVQEYPANSTPTFFF